VLTVVAAAFRSSGDKRKSIKPFLEEISVLFSNSTKTWIKHRDRPAYASEFDSEAKVLHARRNPTAPQRLIHLESLEILRMQTAVWRLEYRLCVIAWTCLRWGVW
jgi:hypothetical protein